MNSKFKKVLLAIFGITFAVKASAGWQPSNETMVDPWEIMNACSDNLIPILEMREGCKQQIKINVLRSYFESKNGIETLREVKISLPGSECQLIIYKDLGEAGVVNRPGLFSELPIGEIAGKQPPRWGQFNIDSEILKNCKVENKEKILSAKYDDDNVIEVNKNNLQQVKPLIPTDIYTMMVNPYVSNAIGGLVIYSNSDKTEVIGFIRPTLGHWGWYTRWGVLIPRPRKPESNN